MEAKFHLDRKLRFYRNFKSIDVQARLGYISYLLGAPDEMAVTIYIP